VALGWPLRAASLSQVPGEDDLVERITTAARGVVRGQRGRVAVIGPYPYLRASAPPSVLDQGDDEQSTETPPASAFGDVKRVEQHRAFAVGVDQLVPARPTDQTVRVLADKQSRLRASEEGDTVKLALQPNSRQAGAAMDSSPGRSKRASIARVSQSPWDHDVSPRPDRRPAGQRNLASQAR
jgi:hypothetical protein